MMKIKAPEFEGIKWANSKPLKLEKLKGKPLLVLFWTFSCINCQRTIPYINEWERKYGGLQIIGIHSPEFDFEKKEKNLKKAIKEMRIKFPVCMDNKMVMWEKYNNNYWPAMFLIDQEGFIRYVQFGEGNFDKLEESIQILLNVSKSLMKEKPLNIFADISPKIYAGYLRNDGLGSGLSGRNYIDFGEHQRDILYPDGIWVQKKDYIELQEGPGKISVRFNSDSANAIIEPIKKTKATVYVDFKKKSEIIIDRPSLHNLFSSNKIKDRELSIVFDGKVRIYAFSFM